ncbi:MAG: hypothetical protein MUF87_06250 [Anaerolineae bacterium]|jgi:hypothetical protein|nr:hypothetical protein [Anaerolineae bacterium]
MPQLFSRMDNINWLTPAIADILDQGAAPPGGDGSMRELIIQLQDELNALETPAKVVNHRPTPSYTLFYLQLGTMGRVGNRRTVTIPELRRSIGQIAEKHKEWRLGFLPQVEDAPEQVGLFLRTDKHRPLSLRRMLVRGTFRDHQSLLAFTLGNTLDQKLIVRDLEETQHLLMIGESAATQHLISGILLTLVLLNTPSEIRLLLAGKGSDAYQGLASLPHSLGPQVKDGEDLVQKLTGLTQEIQKRLDSFYEEGVNSLKAYNARMREQGKLEFPRMVISLDPLFDETFAPFQEKLTPLIRDLLINGVQVGIHLLLALTQRADLPAALDRLINTQILMRSSAPEMGEKLKNFHSSLLRFIDAFIVEGDEKEIIPVELCAVPQSEISAAVEYWQTAVQVRKQEVPNEAISGRTGLTGMLNPNVVLPDTGPLRSATPTSPTSTQQAAMLAAYLGWLSVGALRDIFGLADGEAQTLLNQLQSRGLIEATEGGMFRFVRLGDRPS